MNLQRAAFAATLAAFLLGAAVVAREPLSYDRDVQPIFIAECGDCHGPEKPKKGLVLTVGGREQLLERSSQVERGRRLLVPGDPDASYLWIKLEHRQEEGKGMPRTLFGDRRLSDEQLALIERWIREGARP